MSAYEAYGRAFHNASATLLARVVDYDGTYITQSDISSASYTITEVNSDGTDGDPVTGHNNVSVPVSNLIYDTLQTDNTWTIDDIGYNFRHVLDISTNPAFPAPNKRYRVTFTLTPYSGQKIVVRYVITSV
jgi:hypothetical protein